MSLGDFVLGGIILGGFGQTYVVNGKQYEERYSDEFECNVLVPIDDEEDEY